LEQSENAIKSDLGAILEIRNTNFNNNYRSVTISNYIAPNHKDINASIIMDCTFKWNQDNENILNFNSINHAELSLIQVKAIRIGGCDFINDDFAQMKFGFKPFHFITIIGTFSIFDSLSISETQSYILNNVQKAFNCCEYGLALLISKFVLDEGSIQKFFSSLTQISSNINFDTNLFGNYIAVYLYQNKYLTEFYNLSKNNMSV
jgi:hypothetical protein